jgi:hypothetical protein
MFILVHMGHRYRVSLLASLALAVASHSVGVAQTPANIAGQWKFQLGQRIFLVLALSSSNGHGGPVSGTLSRPTHFQTADAASFSHVEGPTEVEPIVASEWKGNALLLTVQNPKDGSDTDKYLLSVKDSTHAELQFDSVPLPPLKLERAAGIVSIANDWRYGQIYTPEDDAPSNPKMKSIFDEDQRVRQSYPNIDWSSVSKTDAARRAETMQLLKDGALHSGEDFTWAAFIFQHGSTPDDYLLAHTLAIIAIRKGYDDATWIASATLDRYLQSIKQPQIYGTQFLTTDKQPTTQDPYNRALIPDALRRQLSVPEMAAQKVQQQQYDSLRHIDIKSGQP